MTYDDLLDLVAHHTAEADYHLKAFQRVREAGNAHAAYEHYKKHKQHAGWSINLIGMADGFAQAFPELKTLSKQTK
ncbi:hypothetical protein OH491_13700 [Termitidicoccus mucosus]|uniref:Uncharacterized protein n=1 Tax=Termitidicoccus mucosus TaxID=1184151 RepID=A0A178II50_9BACT|nr:hypothetical protein AW736_13755 [Opitutaceae bacterium TSB47]